MNFFIDPYAVSIFIAFPDGSNSKYLLIRRCSKYLPGTWQMVTGAVQQGETAWQAALREAHEETGIVPDTLFSADSVETFYLLARDQVAFVPVFLGIVKEIPEVTLSPSEHDAYEWVTYEKAHEMLVWSEQKRILTFVHENMILRKPHELLKINVTSSQVKIQKKDLSRTGIYGVCINNGKILLITQRSGPHATKYDLPGGGIEIGESLEEALKREFAEELHMSFKTMSHQNNYTANVPIVDALGNPSHLFHQIGLVYQVDGLHPLEGLPSEHVHTFAWVEFANLNKNNTSPILFQFLSEIGK